MAASVRDSISSVASSGTITVDYSTLTHEADDVLVLFVFGYVSIGNPTNATLTWSERLTDTDTNSDGFTTVHEVWTAVSDGSADSFTMTNGISDQWGWAMVSVQDADTSAPIDASGITSAKFNVTANPTSPSISPIGADSLLLCGAGVWPDNGNQWGTFTPPSGMSELEDWVSWDKYSVAALGLSASGATGTKAFTETPSLINSQCWIASSIAIKSAAGGTDHPVNTTESVGVTDTAALSVSRVLESVDVVGVVDTADVQLPGGEDIVHHIDYHLRFVT
jgi:hypothetical protein